MVTYLDCEHAYCSDYIQRVAKNTIFGKGRIEFPNCSGHFNGCYLCEMGHDSGDCKVDDMGETW